MAYGAVRHRKAKAERSVSSPKYIHLTAAVGRSGTGKHGHYFAKVCPHALGDPKRTTTIEVSTKNYQRNRCGFGTSASSPTAAFKKALRNLASKKL